jgi:hypothetical protein
MAKLSWTFKNQDAASYDFTSSVQSFTYTQGRQNVLDNYPGGNCYITMRNNAGQVAAASLAYRQKVYLRCENNVTFRGWVQAIDYIDTPGNANDATAIITLVDAWVLAGQQIATSQVLVSNTNQIDEISVLQFYPSNFQQVYFAPTSSIRGSLNYSQDWASRLNIIVASDRGAFFVFNGTHNYFPLNQLTYNNNNTYTFGRTASASVIAYESFNRIAAVSNQTFVNQALVTPESLATQSHSNDTALIYGTSAVTVATLNTTVTDGLNTAKWIANSMGDSLTRQSYRISVKDISQTAIANLADMLSYTQNLSLAYTPPGGVSTSERTLTEGLTVRGYPDRTEIDFYLSPYTYYNMFILNDTINGVLDSSRLGW